MGTKYKIGIKKFYYLLLMLDAANSHQVNSFLTRTNFEPGQNVLCNPAQICVIYSGYLTKNKSIQKDYQANEGELQYRKGYLGYRRLKFQAFKLAKVSLREALQDKDFYDPISVGIDFPEHHGYHCNFICKVNLECQLPIQFCLPNL